MTRLFFPEAYADKKRLANYANVLWGAFLDVIEDYNVPDIDIPMKYFMKAIIYCLKNYGKFGEGIYFPDKNAWEDAANNSGYLKSVECIGM